MDPQGNIRELTPENPLEPDEVAITEKEMKKLLKEVPWERNARLVELRKRKGMNRAAKKRAKKDQKKNRK